MKYLKFLFISYILALFSLPVSNFFYIDVQALFRFPILNIRYFDIAIFFVIIVSFYNGIITLKRTFKSKTTSILILLIFFFSLFQIFNFIRTLGVIEINAQLAFLGAYLSIFVVYFVIVNFDVYQLLKIIKQIIIPLSIVILIMNISLLYLLLAGKALVLQDIMGERILFDVKGSKEVIGTINITMLTFLAALYRKELYAKKKSLNLILVFNFITTIFISFFSFHRVTVLGLILCIIVYFISILKKDFRNLVKLSFIFLFFTIIIFSFINSFLFYFEKIGINPIQNLINTINFAFDVDNPNWDKGREFSRIIGMQIWYTNFWFGMGMNYMDLVSKIYNIATPHHLIITSLMHNGLIGTILFTSIYIIFYLKTFKLFMKVIKGNLIGEEKILSIILVTTSIIWLFTAFTQEIQLERYSSSIQYFIFATIIKIDDWYENSKT